MDRKRILRVGAIVAVAGVTGFVMQSQDKAPATQRVSAAVMMPLAGPPLVAAAIPAAPALGTETAFVGSALAEPAALAPIEVAAVGPDNAGPLVLTPQPTPDTPEVAAEPCDEDMALIPRAGAMLDIGLLATCRPDQRVLIRHGGLVVTAQTSAAGTLVASIPALHSPAEVTIAFADGTGVTQNAEVADLAQFDRFAVQWMGDDAFQLHAYLNATPGEAGHIDASAPREVSAKGGYLTVAGNPATDRPLLAQVFTWPAGVGALSDAVTLDIESAVTEATCGREILGETLQLLAGRMTVRDLTIAMPDCTAVGEYVVLPNPVMTEKMAANTP